MVKFKPEHLNQNLVARNNVSYTSQLQLCELYDKLETLIEEGMLHSPLKLIERLLIRLNN